MELKRYQARTLSAVSEFLHRAKYMGAAEAFAAVRNAPGYRARYEPLPELRGVPYVCVRVPTGGGKTFMAAHLPRLSADFLERERPCVLWLVPTEMIRAQTLATLRDPDHPNARALSDAFGGEVRVFDITEAADLRRQDMTGKVCVFVATFASLRVTNTAGRRVYAHSENFEPHFADVPPAAREGMEKREGTDEVKFSFANLLSFLHPLVLVDEAHNNKSKLSAETLARISPSLVIEFTATPAGNSNVLYKVSASELKEEGMIKLPIRLEERPNAEETIAAAVQRRKALEEAARMGARYIRPIVLFQAEPKDREWTAERLREYLISEEHILAEEIAVATGTQKELAGIDLFDRACPVRFIITVEALREGWDCSFAYVLCSLARVTSSTAAEQFLGRVMRMPYVERQAEAALNKAYAFVNGSAWTDSVAGIRDQLVSMGFDDAEARENLEYDPDSVPGNFSPQPVSFVVSEEPERFGEHFALHEAEVERREDGNFLVTVTLHDAETAREILAYAETVFKKLENVSAVRRAVSHVSFVPSVPAEKTPSERGVEFPVPMLCLFTEGETVTVEEDAFLPDGFNPARLSPELDNFFYDAEARTVELDIRGTREGGIRIAERQADAYGASLFSTDWTEADLLVWLCRRVREPDVSYQQMNGYLLLVVDALRTERRMPLADLVRYRYRLAEAVRDRLARERENLSKRNYQELLFTEAGSKRLSLANPVVFAKNYPVKNCYQGNYSFQKHFFPLIGDMNPEEEEAAKILDRSDQVDFWIRNLEKQPATAFWLQTSTDKFYPDFVAKLTDGRIFVLEHKGMDRMSNDDSREKRALGNLWASLSEGKGIFLMSCLMDEKGRSLAQQITEVMGK